MPTCTHCQTQVPYTTLCCPVCGEATSAVSQMVGKVIEPVRKGIEQVATLDLALPILAALVLAGLALSRKRVGSTQDGWVKENSPQIATGP